MRDNSMDADSKGHKVLFFPCNHVPLGFRVQSVTHTDLSQAAKMLGRRGGLAKSKAKVKASKENGKKGGRPRKRANQSKAS